MTTPLYTTATAARELGCSARTIQRVAAQHAIGVYVGRSICLTAGDLSALRGLVREAAGNPNFRGKTAPKKKRRK